MVPTHLLKGFGMSQNEFYHSLKNGRDVMNITPLGIDIAKNVFELHGVDAQGKVMLSQRISRAKLPERIAQLPECLIDMEACGGSHYWARVFQRSGHEVKLMNPQFVKPYVKSNKNDSQDAQAICEAVARPSMRFVAVKNVAQQDIQALHRMRDQVVKSRTALVNQIRGLLAEYSEIPSFFVSLNSLILLINSV
jgi:transposase